MDGVFLGLPAPETAEECMARDRNLLGNSARSRWTPVVLLGVAVAYFALATLGLLVAQVHPSATALWPPAGFALAPDFLRGVKEVGRDIV